MIILSLSFISVTWPWRHLILNCAFKIAHFFFFAKISWLDSIK